MHQHGHNICSATQKLRKLEQCAQIKYSTGFAATFCEQ